MRSSLWGDKPTVHTLRNECTLYRYSGHILWRGVDDRVDAMTLPNVAQFEWLRATALILCKAAFPIEINANNAETG